MQKVCFPKYLKPKKNENIVRLGRSNDGGYLLSSEDIMKSDCLISFGIGDDWSFEKDFIKYNKIPLFAFDGSLNIRFWLERLLAAVVHRRIFKMFDFIRFKSFFRGSNNFYKLMIGFKGTSNHLSFDEVVALAKEKKCKNIYLKIDIEGWEYRLLDSLIEHSSLVMGVVIEFHDIDLHLDKIEKFVENFPLNIMHVHSNNYSLIDPNDLPLSIEVSFTSDNVSEETVSLPHSLDQPNNPQAEDYEITFDEGKSVATHCAIKVSVCRPHRLSLVEPIAKEAVRRSC